ncbi:MAG: hypothetical protein JAY73_05930 [Candidatus Thiodiazotropha taylori]|nr:hypothetical protein [Candidatus Thiodiazotropha taylori]MCG8056610.1 hypothetical protein [Candidatus Thiodiazotropha taylori]MCG8080536.1 hypothetical protein [Candidatus Thiodiazotropha taylori]MCW4318443.1 hypothetical protein [Candidatus Thiodiazotropha taylori]
MKKTVLGALFIASLPTHAQEVPKERWVNAMKTAIPAYFCQEAQYFRQCFNVTITECEEVAASATRICLNDLNAQFPNILVQPRDGTLWGNKVGTCAGTAYETSLIEKRISNKKCNNISNWK